MPRRNRPWVETRGGVQRVRWEDPDGRVRSASRDDAGSRFADDEEALDYGRDQIRAAQRGTWRDPAGGLTPISELVKMSREKQSVAETTDRTYRYVTEYLILPYWGQRELREVNARLYWRWVRKLQDEGRAPNTIRNARTRFNALMEDAVEFDLHDANPLPRRRRGQRDPLEDDEADDEESLWVSPLRGLVVAERCALLTGQWTSAVAVITQQWTGARPGEIRGLEEQYLRPDELKVHWQLRDLQGKYQRAVPKRRSRRSAHLPPGVGGLLEQFVADQPPRECSCSGKHPGGPYVFLGPGRGHLPNSNWAYRTFNTAVSGRWHRPSREETPVRLRRGGTPLRSTGGRRRTDGTRQPPPTTVASWLPVEDGLTPHDLRHSHNVLLDELDVPEIAIRERLWGRPRRPTVRETYSHVSTAMLTAMLDGLEEQWQQTLTARAGLGPSSVPELEQLLAPLRRGPRVLDLGARAPKLLPRTA